ncbi:hypothetical protein GCK72_003613 [Caenorhabditis remanei]|uniref:DUF6570 domain-containing protein n=1 Tax=Caenorhabditis remanei TaxID=31234 RepID=A0A6A5HXN9_CAERE|nr:hypothetical protein GCK72_003613 [Caenorhabditis remanei]KAF1771784.1 hypothetical protein GCK72_003613 [Caenorhabditis remanei]
MDAPQNNYLRWIDSRRDLVLLNTDLLISYYVLLDLWAKSLLPDYIPYIEPAIAIQHDKGARNVFEGRKLVFQTYKKKNKAATNLAKLTPTKANPLKPPDKDVITLDDSAVTVVVPPLKVCESKIPVSISSSDVIIIDSPMPQDQEDGSESIIVDSDGGMEGGKLEKRIPKKQRRKSVNQKSYRKKLTGYVVRQIGLRRYHYKKVEENCDGYERMEYLLPQIHKEFMGYCTQHSRENEAEKEGSAEENEEISSDEFEMKDVGEETRKEHIKKCTMIRKCDSQCPLVTPSEFQTMKSIFKRNESIANMSEFARNMITITDENVSEGVILSAFLKRSYNCFSGIRSLCKKVENIANTSQALVKLEISLESGTIEEQDEALVMPGLHLSTKIDFLRKKPMENKRLTQVDFMRSHGKEIQEFHTQIGKDETYSCAVCHKLSLAENLIKWDSSKILAFLPEGASETLQVDVCRLCRLSIRNNKMPADAVANQMDIDQTPDCLKDLNWIEKAMIQVVRPIQPVVHLKDNGGRKTPIKAAGGVMVLVKVPIQATFDHIVQTLPSAKHLKIIVDAGFQKRICSVPKMIKALKYLKINNSKYASITINEAFHLDKTDAIIFKRPTSDQYEKLVANSVAEESTLITKDDLNLEHIKDNDILDEPLNAVGRYTLNKLKYNPQSISDLEDVETLV